MRSRQRRHHTKHLQKVHPQKLPSPSPGDSGIRLVLCRAFVEQPQHSPKTCTDFENKIRLRAFASTTCMSKQSQAGVRQEGLCTSATALPGLQLLLELHRSLGGLSENEGNNRNCLSPGCHPYCTLLAQHQYTLGSCCAHWLVPDGKGQPAQESTAHFPVDQMTFEEL